MVRKLIGTAAALALAALFLAACGSDDSTSSTAATPTTAETTTDSAGSGGGAASGGASGAITTAADPGGALMYTSGDLSAKAGEVTLTFDNPSSTPHDTVVEDADGNEVGSTDVISDSSAETTLDLQPGTYTYYCSVDSHREAGMEATITVK